MMKNFGDAASKISINSDTEVFADADRLNPVYRNAVEAAQSYQLIKGMGDGYFRPTETLTRAQAASVIYSALSLYLVLGGSSNI